jgi:hypothetical protein
VEVICTEEGIQVAEESKFDEEWGVNLTNVPTGMPIAKLLDRSEEVSEKKEMSKYHGEGMRKSTRVLVNETSALRSDAMILTHLSNPFLDSLRSSLAAQQANAADHRKRS